MFLPATEKQKVQQKELLEFIRLTLDLFMLFKGTHVSQR